ncbi:glycoside hydrolase family 3 C-terminal domain-containing protein [Actinokineospora sp. 24-640]
MRERSPDDRDDEIARLADKLDLPAKVALLTGATVWSSRAAPEVGLPSLVFSDGPAGVRGPDWDERRTSLTLPSPTAVAAAWDLDLARELGELLAEEARARGVAVVLAPTLNLHRSPLGGRHFECFSEDPLLTAQLGAAMVAGIQSRGVAATAKHYVANDAETERLTVDVRVDERTLREVYLAPFEAAVRAGVWVVMSAYGGVNGATMTENPLLETPLKTEWGFTGLVLSDWGAVRSTAPAACSGQDLAMPGPDGPWGAALVAAVEAGEVPEPAVTDKVHRLLRLARRVWPSHLGPETPHADTGEPNQPTQSGPQGASEAAGEGWPGAQGVGGAVGIDAVVGEELVGGEGAGAHREVGRLLLRRAVAAGSVLLRNDGLLPLAGVGRLAVVGPGAVGVRVQGGGSAGVYPERVVTPLAGIVAGFAGEVRHAVGCRVGERPTAVDFGCDPESGASGVRVRALSSEGAVLVSEHRLTGWLPEPAVVPDAVAVEVEAVLRPAVGGRWRLAVAGWGAVRLAVDGRVVLSDVVERDTDDPATVHLSPPYRCVDVALEAGVDVRVTATRALGPGDGRAVVLAADAPRADDDALIAEAARVAGECDAVVVVVGTTEEAEGEGVDRVSLALPGRQDDLVRAVAAANPRVAVVVNSGGPVLLPWRDEVAAVLLAWFPGQEAGHGLADVLLGAVEPGGRLPTTWPAHQADVPVLDTTPVDGALVYAEGTDIGYRAWAAAGRTPAYWFGHGLGYTTWECRSVSLADGGVRVDLRNTGAREGRHVVQLYAAGPGETRRLAGHAAVTAGPGETATAVVPVAGQRRWTARGWRPVPGPVTVTAGPSAGEVWGEVTLPDSWPGP